MNRINRKKFTSRTLDNDLSDSEGYSFGEAFLKHPSGFITHNQLTGWSFLMRRLSSGLALGDTRMLTEALRTQSRSLNLGFLILLTISVGCFLFSVIHPSQTTGSQLFLVDSSTHEQYVRINDKVYPVLNLASARLIVGKAVTARPVKTKEIQRSTMGNLLGIPGAPNSFFQIDQRTSQWTVCDSFSGNTQGISIISLPAFQANTPNMHFLKKNEAFLVTANKTNWLLWNGFRRKINVKNRWVTSALGMGMDTPSPQPIELGLLDTIPEQPRLDTPYIPFNDLLTSYAIPDKGQVPIGTVARSTKSDGSFQYYVILINGLEPISPIIASMITNKPNYRTKQTFEISQNYITKLPVSHSIDTNNYPDQPLHIIDPENEPIACVQWYKNAHSEVTHFELIAGVSLPVRNYNTAVELVGKFDPTTHSPTATRVFLPSGKGYYVQIVGQESHSPLHNWQYWINDTGVRFAIDTTSDAKTPTILGLTGEPLPIPWSILRLFAPGPTLSRLTALYAHDSLVDLPPISQ